MKSAVCVAFEVRHGSAGSRCSQNRNRTLSRAARLRKPNTQRRTEKEKRVGNWRNVACAGLEGDPSPPRRIGLTRGSDAAVRHRG